MKIGFVLKKVTDKITFFYPDIYLYYRLRLRARAMYNMLRIPTRAKVTLTELVSKFRQKADRVYGISDAIDFVYSWSESGVDIRPYQVRSEIPEFLKLAHKPKTVLEIGSAKGGTLFLLTRTADINARIISLDLPHGLFGGDFDRVHEALFRSFPLGNQELHTLRMNSHKRKTLRKVKSILNGRTIDLAFIDADHTYKGVRRDFEQYFPLMTKGGILGFHDILATGGEFHLMQVYRFWNEVKRRHRHLEIGNIGVIYA